ncbi:MAG: hypothetical protein DRJ59_05050 [Thermoprotei archaeon]|nr:MAG: hypothetical protein DRJ59_05050 [Thermoprotei archaeon]
MTYAEGFRDLFNSSLPVLQKAYALKITVAKYVIVAIIGLRKPSGMCIANFLFQYFKQYVSITIFIKM